MPRPADALVFAAALRGDGQAPWFRDACAPRAYKRTMSPCQRTDLVPTGLDPVVPVEVRLVQPSGKSEPASP